VYAVLAQATATAAASLPPFDYTLWAPAHSRLALALIMLGSTLLAGVLIYVLTHRHVKALRLTTSFSVALAALTLYLAAWGYNKSRMNDPLDPIAYWITRAFAGAMVFVLLRVLDRLAIVPLLTHGGRIAIPRLFHQIINILLVVFTILIFGSRAFGWDIDRFLAGSAVVSIVLGLALQETLGNFFSGLVMQASPPFAIGDWIVCADHEGRVVDMTWRAVTLHTNDDNFILIPNATVAKGDVVNYHAPTTATARTVKVSLESDVPPAEAIAILKAAAVETPGVQAAPEPFVFLEDYGDAVDYLVKFWISEPRAHHRLEHDVRVHIWYRLREAGIILPNPVRTVEYVSQKEKARRQREAARGHRLAAIENVPLLAPLTAEEKLQLANSAGDVFLTTGQILFRQNDAGSSFYIIYKGAIEVLVSPDGAAAAEQHVVATLKPGDFFGEMSALTGQPRTATIRAASPLACVEIEKRDLLAIFQRDPEMMGRISEIVARRNAQREAILHNAGAAPAPELVFKQQQSLLGRMMSFFGLGKAA